MDEFQDQITRAAEKARFMARVESVRIKFDDHIARSADKAVAMSERLAGHRLDYSEGSLDVVEQLLTEASKFIGRMSSQQVTALVQNFGCYLLEMSRRQFGGRYLWHDDREQPVLVVGEPAFRIAMITWDKVGGRLRGDEADNIPFFYAGFAERVGNAKPGDDALYV